MSKVVFYSFRTNKALEEFHASGVPVFVFGSLRKDFEVFSEMLAREKPDMVLGTASISGRSRSEVIAINRFGRARKISKAGKDFYALENLSGKGFGVGTTSTASFCNWTMYRTKEFIEENALDTKVGFVHFNPADTKRLIGMCRILTNAR